jgi:hypothetical protein
VERHLARIAKKNGDEDVNGPSVRNKLSEFKKKGQEE